MPSFRMNQSNFLVCTKELVHHVPFILLTCSSRHLVMSVYEKGHAFQLGCQPSPPQAMIGALPPGPRLAAARARFVSYTLYNSKGTSVRQAW